MKTTKIAQYAADAANSSCLAALVKRLIAALKSNVNTISTPTALNVSRLFVSTLLVVVALLDRSVSACAAVLVSWYMVMTGITRRQNMMKVMRTFTSLSTRELL
jgi:hypothetical protein